jgi:hypothetical protein
MIAPPATTDGAVVSKEQLTMAYLRGDLGRRQFVRGLVALGVAFTAALAYADMPARANAGTSQPTGLAQACLHVPPVIHFELCGA